MKIAIDISQIAYERTGVAGYTRELVSNLLRKDKINNYLLFAYSFRKLSVIKNYLNTLSVPKSRYELRLFNFPQIAANLIWNGLHLLPLEKLIGSVDLYFSSDWIQIPSSAKKITTVHDLIVYRFPQTSVKSIIDTQKRRMEHVKNECNLIFADSNATKNDLIEILGINDHKIKVIYPGVNDSFIVPSSSSVKSVLAKYNLKCPFILSVGKNDPRKNLPRLINSINKLSIATNLVIVMQEGWGEQITEEGKIRILKNVEDIDMPSLYGAAEMFVFPSLYEGFGLPVIEAMKCGCPVITSNRGSLAEIAADSALFVNPESEVDISAKILKLKKDPDLRIQLVQKGLKNAMRFSWEKSAREIIRIYKSL